MLTFAGLWGVPFLVTHHGFTTAQAAGSPTPITLGSAVNVVGANSVATVVSRFVVVAGGTSVRVFTVQQPPGVPGGAAPPPLGLITRFLVPTSNAQSHAEKLRRLLCPAPAAALVATSVSPRANSVTNDDAECLAPYVGEEPKQAALL